MKRLLLFAHYNKNGGLSSHVLYLLEHIKPIYSRIVFISNSVLEDAHREALLTYCDDVLQRSNSGLNFSAWREAMLREGFEKLAEYDNVTLMNDTCFGPVYDLEPYYLKMEEKGTDFWGFTTHYKTRKISKFTLTIIPECLDSYFLCFNKAAISSGVFKKFWLKLREKEKRETIHKKAAFLQRQFEKKSFVYSHKLEELLKSKGLTCDCAITIFKPLAHRPDNVALRHPDINLLSGNPFVTINSFAYFQHPQYVLGLLKEKTGYPVSLITGYCNEYFTPNETLLLDSKVVRVSHSPDKKEMSAVLKAAVHLHVYYPDLFEKYVSYFNQMDYPFDLYITTDNPQKEQYIKEFLSKNYKHSNLTEVITTKNAGRDVIPWFSIKDKLANYDIAGHFHTKKSPLVDDWVGVTWQQEMFDMLLVPLNKIAETFSENPKVGVIIPQIPHFFHVVAIDRIYERAFGKQLNNLWEKLKCKKQINFKNLPDFIMPYGTMLWYRPRALKPLFDFKIDEDEIREPLPADKTILHCLERILVYLAWDEGYDYRIMSPEKPDASCFYDSTQFFKQIRSKTDLTTRSSVYKIIILFLSIPLCLFIYKTGGPLLFISLCIILLSVPLGLRCARSLIKSIIKREWI